MATNTHTIVVRNPESQIFKVLELLRNHKQEEIEKMNRERENKRILRI